MTSVILLDCVIDCPICGDYRTLKDHCEKGFHNQECGYCSEEDDYDSHEENR